MHEPNSRIELRITRQPLLQSGYADQNQPKLPLVEDRPDLFEARHAMPVRLVDQNE